MKTKQEQRNTKLSSCREKWILFKGKYEGGTMLKVGAEKPENSMGYCSYALTPSEYDAAFIVRAVNSHEKMLSALKYVREFYQTNFDVMPVAFQTVDNEIEQAIKQAEGGLI